MVEKENPEWDNDDDSIREQNIGYRAEYLDYKLSPYTGLTRESWIAAAKLLLGGVFRHISSTSDPVIVPRTETKITYPHENADETQLKLERMAERFEGLARTFFIAAPLIKNEPNVKIEGIKLKDYYSKQIVKAVTPEDENYVGDYEYLAELIGDKGGFHAFQQTVETCALVICLDVCRDEIWNKYSKRNKNKIAKFLAGYAKAPTVPQNWRLFNMLDMAFLNMEGYEIDRQIMRGHAQAILNYYAGNGWYRDGHSFDYYSCWAFNVYAPIWNKWYGYENEPLIAAEFEKNANELMKTYPDFFDRDGHMNMWGRSSIYRNAAAAPLAENFNLKNPASDPGLARRIMSGTLMQFLERKDFLNDGIPALGFYREFPQIIQGYSCAESVYWLGKAFLCLALPKEHPFWTAKENNGSWEKLKEGEVKETVLNGPALCFTNHEKTGATILRTGKVFRHPDDCHGMDCYAKLQYSTQYPWSDSILGIDSMQYVIRTDGEEPERCNAIFWRGMKNRVLYRRAFFNLSPDTSEMHWAHAIDLADFPVERGIMRADRLRAFRGPIKIHLGSFGMPYTVMHTIPVLAEGYHAVILQGYDYLDNEKQIAMTVFSGWDDLGFALSPDVSPDTGGGFTIYATTEKKELYGNDSFMLVSQVITKESHEPFEYDELFPISSIKYSDPEGRGAYGPATIYFKNGKRRKIDFGAVEGNLMI